MAPAVTGNEGLFRVLVLAPLLTPTLAFAASPAQAPWEAGGFAVAAGLGVVAVLLVGLGLVMGMVRKMIMLAKVALALGILTLTVAIGTAAALIWAF